MMDSRINQHSVVAFSCKTWWRYQMETFSSLLALCAGNLPVTGEFPSQRPVTRNFDVFFDQRLYKRLSKNPNASDLRRHSFHYVVAVMIHFCLEISHVIASISPSFSSPLDEYSFGPGCTMPVPDQERAQKINHHLLDSSSTTCTYAWVQQIYSGRNWCITMTSLKRHGGKIIAPLCVNVVKVSVRIMQQGLEFVVLCQRLSPLYSPKSLTHIPVLI